ncbi:hypothetical protein LWI28_022552 [Acer negundo]|uniref:Cytochrome P450 n=1 Tax=Acer negundo TaxID=4023 RepID=A0AAD5J122_ACENE|nr:hypothetical protein LWI28_022552 [Acer negundo]
MTRVSSQHPTDDTMNSRQRLGDVPGHVTTDLYTGNDWASFKAQHSVAISHLFYSWANPKCKNGKLPPGSMGLPFVGETLRFFSSHSFYDIPPFMSKRIARHGHLFRTSLIGQRVVVSTDPEINYKVLQQENESLVMWYTDCFLGIVGTEEDLMAIHGSAHKYLKNLMLQFLGPENVRVKLLPKVDEATRKHLHSWASNGSIDVKHGAAYMIFESFGKNLLSYDEDEITKTLVESFEAFMDGFVSFPLYIPGTAFYACIQGRKKAMKVIKDMYQARKASKNRSHGDFMDRLLEEVEKENTIVDESLAINLVFVLLFAAYEAASQALTLLTKFVFENPNVLQELMGKELHSGSKTFMAFGGSVRLCLGAEFAKVQMAIYLHYLVTKYRYGPLFRAGLLEQRMVVSIDPETNFSMFKQENPDLLLWYGGSFEEMIGDEKFLASHGSIRKYMKNLILSFVGPENLRTKLLHQMDVVTQRHLHSWATDGRVDVKDASPKMLFEFVAGKLLSYDEVKQAKKLGENLKTFKDGLTSFPLNIPGTTFHGCIQAHKRAMKAIEEIYLERKASKIPGNDFLDNIIAETAKKDTFLNDTNVTKLPFAILLAGYESTPQAVTLVTKLVADHPDVLAELMVINETVLLGNMVPGIFRKAMKDVEINAASLDNEMSPNAPPVWDSSLVLTSAQPIPPIRSVRSRQPPSYLKHYHCPTLPHVANLVQSDSKETKPSYENSWFLIQMLLELVAGKLLSYDESKQAKKLEENYKTFKDGLVSLPLNIPGRTFHACMQVINETIRLSNMVPGIFRKVTKDMQINGYTIPKGWIIMAALPVVHLSEYENPFCFQSMALAGN